MAQTIWTNEERNAKYPHLAQLYTPVAGETLEEAAYRIGRADADDRASGDNWQADQDGYSSYNYYTGYQGGDDSDRPAWREAYKRGNEERLRELFAETGNAFYLHQIHPTTPDEDREISARWCRSNIKHLKDGSKTVRESRQWLINNGFSEE